MIKIDKLDLELDYGVGNKEEEVKTPGRVLSIAEAIDEVMRDSGLRATVIEKTINQKKREHREKNRW